MISFLLFIIPTLYIEMFVSNITYNDRSNQTKMFIDTVINKGYIDEHMYNTYLKGLKLNDELKLDIKIKRNVAMLEDEAVVYKDFLLTNCTIKKYIDDKKIFKLNIGDEILITIDSNYNATLNMLIKKIFKTDMSMNIDLIRYGGIIKNEVI